MKFFSMCWQRGADNTALLNGSYYSVCDIFCVTSDYYYCNCVVCPLLLLLFIDYIIDLGFPWSIDIIVLYCPSFLIQWCGFWTVPTHTICNAPARAPRVPRAPHGLPHPFAHVTYCLYGYRSPRYHYARALPTHTRLALATRYPGCTAFSLYPAHLHAARCADYPFAHGVTTTFPRTPYRPMRISPRHATLQRAPGTPSAPT